MGLSVLILQGDAEALLFAQAELTLQACFPSAEISVHSAWTTRSDLLGDAATDNQAKGGWGKPPISELLAQPHDLVILSTLPDVALPLWSGPRGRFVVHRGVAESWSASERSEVEGESSVGAMVDLEAAVESLQRVIEELMSRGQAVALCNVFRRVPEPLQHRVTPGSVSLRRRALAMNLEVAKLSHRTGCFVVDLDRVLAHEGGAALNADCFGGGERAEELALEELVAVVLEALPQATGEHT